MLPGTDVEFVAPVQCGNTAVSDMTTVAPEALSSMVGLRRNWGSVAAFQRHGIGFRTTVRDAIVTVCFAVAVAAGGAPIQISTEREHQRRGYARMAAEQFMQRCRERNIVAHWECDESNDASFQLAPRQLRDAGIRYHLKSSCYDVAHALTVR